MACRPGGGGAAKAAPRPGLLLPRLSKRELSGQENPVATRRLGKGRPQAPEGVGRESKLSSQLPCTRKKTYTVRAKRRRTGERSAGEGNPNRRGEADDEFPPQDGQGTPMRCQTHHAHISVNVLYKQMCLTDEEIKGQSPISGPGWCKGKTMHKSTGNKITERLRARKATCTSDPG